MSMVLHKPKILVQKKLSNVLVLFSNRKIDFGTLTTELMAKILIEDTDLKRRIEDALGIKYDHIEYWELQQPPDTSDIELYYKGEKVLGISLKTTTTKNLKPQILKLGKILRRGEIGAIAFPTRMRKAKEEDIVVAIAIFTREMYENLGANGITRQIIEEINKKKTSEGLDELALVNLGQVSSLTALRLGYEAKAIAEEAKIAAERAEKIGMENRKMLTMLIAKIDEIAEALGLKKKKKDRKDDES